MIIDKSKLDTFDKRYRAALINSIHGFKPINLIGSIDSEGLSNLAIFSSVTHFGADPALFGLISRPDSVNRHTLENIRQTNFFTVNHVNADILEQAHQTSARYPREVSEFDAVGLQSEYVDNFPAPFVQESHIKFGCKLVREIPIQENGTILVLAQIETIILPEEIIEDDGHINIEKADTITGSGLSRYHETKLIKRLAYAKPQQK